MFSEIESNRKTFEIVQKYIIYLENNECNCTNIDNIIEIDAIKEWLKELAMDSHDNASILKWIKENGKSFRDYLNTVKLIYLIWFCTRGKSKTMSWEQFCTIGHNLNHKKDTCLDSIY